MRERIGGGAAKGARCQRGAGLYSHLLFGVDGSNVMNCA